MSMTKRIQIPVTEPEEKLFKLAAKKRGLSLAEWARQLMKEKAQEPLSNRSPEDALRELFAIDAPIDNVDTMIKQSFKGRYKSSS